MMHVAVICAVFLVASFAMLSKLGKSNSATLEAAVANSRHEKFETVASKDFYIGQFEEAAASYR